MEIFILTINYFSEKMGNTSMKGKLPMLVQPELLISEKKNWLPVLNN